LPGQYFDLVAIQSLASASVAARTRWRSAPFNTFSREISTDRLRAVFLFVGFAGSFEQGEDLFRKASDFGARGFGVKTPRARRSITKLGQGKKPEASGDDEGQKYVRRA
jgi:hypothetical protein